MATGFSSRNELDNLEGKKTTNSGGWSKRVGRWFKTQRRRMVDRRLKRQLARLEKERLKEKTALNEQRHLYEGLFKRRLRSVMSPAPRVTEAKAPAIPAPAIKEAPAVKAPVAPTPQHPLQIPVPPLAPLPPLPPLVSLTVVSSAPTTSEKSNTVVLPPAPLAPRNNVLPKVPVAQPKTVAIPTPIVQTETLPIAPAPSAKITLAPTPLSKPQGAKKSLFTRLFSGRAKTLSEKLARERADELAWQERNEVERRFWQPYRGVKPNLIKDQGTIFFNWHEHMLILGLSLVMCCLAIGLVYVGLLIWEKERMDNNQASVLNTAVIDAEIERSEKEMDEVRAFNEKLKTVSSLLNNHVYWSNLFTFFEENTLKEVYFDKFNGDLTGKFTIPAVARNLESISYQLDVLKASDKVKDASYDTGQGRATSATVKFNLGLTVDPKIFTK